jgi:Tfp pilus assembly protein PilX
MLSDIKKIHKRCCNQEGFTLVTAILAILILTALGILAITASTQDIRTSRHTMGEKKAINAAEAGLHQLIRSFNPEQLINSQATNIVINAAADPGSKYSISAPQRPTTGPSEIPMVGYAIGGGQVWKQRIYVSSVTGVNTRYDSAITIDVGVGHGPVDVNPMHP